MIYDDMIWVWQAIIGNYGSFFALLTSPTHNPPPKNQKPELWKKNLWIDLSFWAMFCPFNLLTTRKIKILKKWKWCLEISSFYTCTINDNHDLWFLKNEAQQAEFSVILGHIPPYPANPKNQNFEKWKNPWWYHHFTQVYQNSWSFAIPFTRYGACCLQLFSIYAPNSPKNLNLTKKKKKMPGDIILHKCNKNHDHMLYCSWDMACDVCNCYFSIWDIFFTFTKKQPQKSKWKKKLKKNC